MYFLGVIKYCCYKISLLKMHNLVTNIVYTQGNKYCIQTNITNKYNKYCIHLGKTTIPIHFLIEYIESTEKIRARVRIRLLKDDGGERRVTLLNIYEKNHLKNKIPNYRSSRTPQFRIPRFLSITKIFFNNNFFSNFDFFNNNIF